ncbi:MAG: homoserine dehydrogenase, partial [Terriglobales bacterium]
MSTAIGVGIVGYGTVGQATAQIIASHAHEITSRCGARLEVRAVCRRGAIPPAEVPAGARVCTDWREVIANPAIAIVVETIGGLTVAREVIEAALARGKPVITANKNLLAHHGESLFAQAAARGLPLGFEAAVAGGIPVIRALAEGTAGDRIRSVYGILNGTSNYILSRMAAAGIGFAPALAEAQRLGYAEPDPSADVEGLDARDKLAILARLAFSASIAPAAIPTTGIRAIEAIDLLYARRLNSTIRLVGAAERDAAGRCAISVRPWLVPEHSLLAQVHGVNNAVFLEGERVGTQM